MVSLWFLPSAFPLLSNLTFSVVETLKGPSVRLSEISSIAAAEITFVLPSFRPALQPISEGSPIDGETDSETLPQFAPFSLFVRDLSFWAPLFDSQHRSR